MAAWPGAGCSREETLSPAAGSEGAVFSVLGPAQIEDLPARWVPAPPPSLSWISAARRQPDRVPTLPSFNMLQDENCESYQSVIHTSSGRTIFHQEVNQNTLVSAQTEVSEHNLTPVKFPVEATSHNEPNTRFNMDETVTIQHANNTVQSSTAHPSDDMPIVTQHQPRSCEQILIRKVAVLSSVTTTPSYPGFCDIRELNWKPPWLQSRAAKKKRVESKSPNKDKAKRTKSEEALPSQTATKATASKTNVTASASQPLLKLNAQKVSPSSNDLEALKKKAWRLEMEKLKLLQKNRELEKEREEMKKVKEEERRRQQLLDKPWRLPKSPVKDIELKEKKSGQVAAKLDNDGPALQSDTAKNILSLEKGQKVVPLKKDVEKVRLYDKKEVREYIKNRRKQRSERRALEVQERQTKEQQLKEKLKLLREKSLQLAKASKSNKGLDVTLENKEPCHSESGSVPHCSASVAVSSVSCESVTKVPTSEETESVPHKPTEILSIKDQEIQSDAYVARLDTVEKKVDSQQNHISDYNSAEAPEMVKSLDSSVTVELEVPTVQLPSRPWLTVPKVAETQELEQLIKAVQQQIFEETTKNTRSSHQFSSVESEPVYSAPLSQISGSRSEPQVTVVSSVHHTTGPASAVQITGQSPAYHQCSGYLQKSQISGFPLTAPFSEQVLGYRTPGPHLSSQFSQVPHQQQNKEIPLLSQVPCITELPLVSCITKPSQALQPVKAPQMSGIPTVVNTSAMSWWTALPNKADDLPNLFMSDSRLSCQSGSLSHSVVGTQLEIETVEFPNENFKLPSAYLEDFIPEQPNYIQYKKPAEASGAELHKKINALLKSRAKEKAAVKIQAAFRGYLIRKKFFKKVDTDSCVHKNVHSSKDDERLRPKNCAAKDILEAGGKCRTAELQSGDNTPEWLKPKPVGSCPNNVLSAAVKQYMKLQKLGLLHGPPINLPDDGRRTLESQMEPSSDVASQTDLLMPTKFVNHPIVNFARLSPEKDVTSQIPTKKSETDIDDIVHNENNCSKVSSQKESSPTVSSTTGDSVAVSSKNSNESQKLSVSAQKNLCNRKQSPQSSSLESVSHRSSLSLVPPNISLVRRWRKNGIHQASASKSDSMLEVNQENKKLPFVPLQTSSSETYDSHRKFVLLRKKPHHQIPKKVSSVKSSSSAILESGDMGGVQMIPVPVQLQQNVQADLDQRQEPLHKTQQVIKLQVTPPAQLEQAQTLQKKQPQQSENLSTLSARINELREMCSEFNHSLEANRQSFDQRVLRNRVELEKMAEQMAEKGRQAIEEFMANHRNIESSISREPQLVPMPLISNNSSVGMRASDVASAFVGIERDVEDVQKIAVETLLDSSADASFRSVLTASKQPSSEDLELGLSEALQQSVSTIPEQNASSRSQKKALAVAAFHMYDELIRDEENKCKQQDDLLKERLKLLSCRTHSNLQWLLLKKQEYRSAGRNEKVSSVRKKQRGIIIKYYEEKESILQLQKLQQQNSKDRIIALKKQQKAHKEIIERLLKLCQYSSGPESNIPSKNYCGSSFQSKNLQSETESSHESTSEIFEEILYDSSNPREKPESELAASLTPSKSSTHTATSTSIAVPTKVSSGVDSEVMQEGIMCLNSATSLKDSRSYFMTSRMREVTPKNSFSSIETVLDGSVASKCSVSSALNKEDRAKPLCCASVQTIELTLGKDNGKVDTTVTNYVKNDDVERKMAEPEKSSNYIFREVYTQTLPASKNCLKLTKPLRDVSTSPLSLEEKENVSSQTSHVSEELDTGVEHHSSSSIPESVRPSTASDKCSNSNQLSCKSTQVSEHIEQQLLVTTLKSQSLPNVMQTSAPLEQKCVKRPDLGIKTLLSLPPTRRHKRRHSSGSDESFIYSQNETLSEQSDMEGRIAALREQLDRRKQEAEKLLREQKRKMRERLKAKEESLLKQIEAYDELIQKTKQELEQDLNSSSSMVIVKPKIKQPRVAEKKQTAKQHASVGAVVLDMGSKTVTSMDVVPSVSSSEAEQVHSVMSNHSIASVSDLESIASVPSTAQESVPEEIANSSGNEASVSNAVSEEEQSREMSIISEREDGSHENSHRSSSPKSVSQELSVPTAIQSPVKLGELYDDYEPVVEEINSENGYKNVFCEVDEEISSLREECTHERVSCDRYSDDFEVGSVNSDHAPETLQSLEDSKVKEVCVVNHNSTEHKCEDQEVNRSKEELFVEQTEEGTSGEELNELGVVVDECSIAAESIDDFVHDVDSMKVGEASKTSTDQEIVNSEEEIKEKAIAEEVLEVTSENNVKKINDRTDSKQAIEERLDEEHIIEEHVIEDRTDEEHVIEGITEDKVDEEHVIEYRTDEENFNMLEDKSFYQSEIEYTVLGYDTKLTKHTSSSSNQIVDAECFTKLLSKDELRFSDDVIEEINAEEFSTVHKQHTESIAEDLKGLMVSADKLSLVESITDLILQQILSEPVLRYRKNHETFGICPEPPPPPPPPPPLPLPLPLPLADKNVVVQTATHENEITPKQHEDIGLDSVDGSLEDNFIPATEFSFKELSFVNTNDFPLVTYRQRYKDALDLERGDRITEFLLEESMKQAAEEVIEIYCEKQRTVVKEEAQNQILSFDVRKRVGEIMTEAKLSPRAVRDTCRVQDLMVTTYDLSPPADTPESAQPSPVDTPDCIFLTGLSVKDLPNGELTEEIKTPGSNETEVGVGIDLSKVSSAECESEWFDEDYGLSQRREAEELRRQQLRIEREIQEIQQAQEQCPYFYIREIPNKPPPPYTPPNQATRTQVLPSPPSQEEVSSLVSCAAESIYEAVQAGNDPDTLLLPPALESKAAFGRFLFQLSCQLVKEVCSWEASHRQPCLPWEWTPCVRQLPPRSRQAVLELVKREVLVMFRFIPRASQDCSGTVRWAHKKRDLVDDLLVCEGHKEEAGWTNYSEDEMTVKNELTNMLLILLLDDTVSVLQKVLTKRFAKQCVTLES